MHLQQGCIDIGNISWSSSDDTHFGEEIFIWQHGPENELGTRGLLNFLEERYELPWVKRASLAKSDYNLNQKVTTSVTYGIEFATYIRN